MSRIKKIIALLIFILIVSIIMFTYKFYFLQQNKIKTTNIEKTLELINNTLEVEIHDN